MREIKFRARDRESGEWRYHEDSGYDFWYGLDDGQYDSETLSQYTGLKDKNGKEIYEGDIVQGNFGIPPIGVRSVVEYEGSAFIIKTPKCNPKEVTLRTGIECLDLHIIGNIYENPELLKEQP